MSGNDKLNHTESSEAETVLQENKARLQAINELSDYIRRTEDAEALPHAAAEILDTRPVTRRQPRWLWYDRR